MTPIARRLAAAALVAALTAGCASTHGATSSPAPAGSDAAKGAPAAGGAAPAPAAAVQPAGGVHHLADGLVFEDLVVGDGTMAEEGMTATVHYTGWLTDGTKFDSSVDRGQPFSFTLGEHHVIAGWEEGVRGMRVGGKRKLTIPPDLGYGAQGAGGVIPPNATLVFEVELLGVN